MYQNRHQRIPVPLRAAQERLNAHAVKEQTEIGKEHIQRVPHCQVPEPLLLRRFQELLFGHYRIRPYAGTKQLRIVVMVVVVLGGVII